MQSCDFLRQAQGGSDSFDVDFPCSQVRAEDFTNAYGVVQERRFSLLSEVEWAAAGRLQLS